MGALGLLWALALVFGLARLARAQVIAARDIADLAAVDRRLRDGARLVRVIGREGTQIALGVGERVGDVYELHAMTFQLAVVDEVDLPVIDVVAGAKLRAIVRDGSFSGSVLRVPAEARLLCRMPPLVREDDTVEQVLAVLRGEAMTLMDPEVDLLAFVRRTRVASVVRVGLVMAGVTALSWIPVVGWIAWLGMVLDQIVLRGTVFALACTRPRDPEYWKQR